MTKEQPQESRPESKSDDSKHKTKKDRKKKKKTPKDARVFYEPEGIQASNRKEFEDFLVAEQKGSKERRGTNKKKGAGKKRMNESQEQPLAEGIVDFLKDDESEMTYGRKLALQLMDKPWYNPAAGEDKDTDHVGAQENHRRARDNPDVVEEERPSLERAWAYFEHVALERYMVQEDGNDKKLERAEPGERGFATKLYAPFKTPHDQLGDFGLGVGLYFSSLRALAIATLLAGFMNLYSVLFFAGDDWNQEKENLPGNALAQLLLQGSAICTDTSWVPCPDCDCNDEVIWGREDASESPRCVEGIAPAGMDSIPFALKNECGVPDKSVAYVNYFTIFFMMVFVLFIGFFMNKQSAKFDEDEQTAQDYSIVIKNPPADALDPDEWKRFFEEKCDGARVTVCTCGVNNDLLIKTLMERRETLRMIRNELPSGTSLDFLDLAHLAAKIERDRSLFESFVAMFSSGVPEHFARLSALQVKVQGLAQLDYPVTNVFLTFETEAEQREVIQKLNNHSHEKFYFRGERALEIDEPVEPNTVRWQDLNVSITDKIKQQAISTTATVIAIVIATVIVYFVSSESFKGGAYTISILNAMFPTLAKILSKSESHAYEVDRQTSLYFKIALFRWVNTAIVITLITPFTLTISAENDGIINKIYSLFFAEIITTNVLQLLDIGGHLNRHVFAPRAKTQDAMNLFFQGEELELAERYTNMTKILFLCLWYSAIYPAAFFMCSFALFINYFTDRFSLMRTWKRPPQLGGNIAKFSRRYFFTLAIAIMAIVSSMFWAGYPYDNLCLIENESIEGTFTLLSEEEGINNVEVNVSNSTQMYRSCLQDLLARGHGFTFPFIPKRQDKYDERWMTPDQEDITKLFGWTSVAILILMLYRLGTGIYKTVKPKKKNSGAGEAQEIPFSEVPSISSYIPEVRSSLFPYPLIAAHTEGLDTDLYDWSDPDRPHSYYDLTHDAEELLRGMDLSHQAGFSVIKHYSPET